MADVRKKQLPNLKISVENTKSSNESEEELDFIDDTIDTVQLDEYDQSEDDGQIEKDVEFNVHIHGSELDKTKTRVSRDRTVSRRKETISAASTASTKLDKTKTRAVSRRKETVSTASTTSSNSASATSSSRHRSKSKEVDKHKSDKALVAKKAPDVNSSIKEKQRLSVPLLPERRLYENKLGSFVTGIDVTTKEAQAKRDQRAQRFKIQSSAAPTSLKLDDVQSLYKSLGVHERDFDNEEKGIRGEALHLRGTDEMNTDDVFQYFSEFPARFVEWINDSSCNVVWDDKVTPVRALLKLTKSHDKVEAEESKKDKKAAEKPSEKQSAPKKQREKKDSAAVNPRISNNSASKRRTSRSTEERMEVDEDELDLMVEDDDLFLTTTSAPEASARKNEKKDQPKKGASDDKGKRASKGGGNAVALVKVKKEKEEERRQQRKGAKNKEGGEDSDSSSSGSSTSSSSSGSGSSDSSSSDGSSSDSSSSDSESDDEKKSKKKAPTKTRRDADTGEVVKGRQTQDKNKRSSIPWPPGKWRLGVPCAKTKYLFIRYATKDDKKEVGAERKSQYYRKYGNPNYGGIRGLISKSRKRRMHNETVDKILKSRGPDARDALEQRRASGRLAGSLAREEGEVSNGEDDIFAVAGEDQLGEQIERWPSRREANLPIERVKDLRQLLKQNTGASKKIIQEETSSAPEVGAKRRKMSAGDVEELDLDAELKQLMRDRPAKKLPYFRMHADEEEERIKARRSRNAGLLTVVKSERSEEGPSRLEGRLQLPAGPWQREQPGQRWWGGDAHFPNSEGDEEEDEEEADDFARALRDYRRLRNIPMPQSSIRPKITAARTSFRQPEVPADVADLTDEEEKEKEVVMTESGDLRSRLQPQAKGRRSFPSMRIEVFDEEED